MRLSSNTQNIESSMSQIEEWDQTDFDELHPSLGNQQTNGEKKPLPRPPANYYALLESRFIMYDLIKITSRKSSTKTITFYFRIPQYHNYQVQNFERDLIQQLD